MPTPFEMQAALDARNAALQVNANQFFGREPPPATPEPERFVEVPEPTTTGASWFTSNTFHSITTRPPLTWETAIATPPPPPAPDVMMDVAFEGMIFSVPEWTTYITQDSNGRIQAWEEEPNDWMGVHYVLSSESRYKTVMNPEVFPRMKVNIA